MPTATPTATNTATTEPATATPTATNTVTTEPATATPTATNTATATPTLPPGDLIKVINPATSDAIDWVEPDSSARISITFPAGVVDATTTFILTNLPAPGANPVGFKFAGTSFAFDAYRNNLPLDNLQFQGDGIILAIIYPDSILAPTDDELQLTLQYLDEATGQWRTDGITVLSRNPATNSVRFAIKHLTQFALFLPNAIPTVPTVPTVLPTNTPTATNTPDDTSTPRPTKTPTRQPTQTPQPTNTPVSTVVTGQDGVLEEQPGSPLAGNNCVTTGGAGLLNNRDGSFQLNVPGTPAHAYLYWSGRYNGLNQGDGAIEIAINGGSPITVLAGKGKVDYAGAGNGYHYTYQSANLVGNNRFAGLLSGLLNIRVNGLQSTGMFGNEGYGVGLVIISDSPSCTNTRVSFFYGLDSFYQGFGGAFGPNSQTLCVDFPTSGVARTLEFQMGVAGAEGGRNALWYKTGAGVKPTELIANNSGVVLDGPPATANSPFGGKSGPQWDNYTNSLVIPAGATYACFQIQSLSPVVAAAGTAQTGAVDGVSAIWVNFTAKLNNGVVPTATPTPQPTVTPTVTGAPTVPPAPTATPAPRFALNVSVTPLNPAPGENLTYRLAYHNNGAVALNNIVLRLTVPEYTTWNQALSSAGWTCANHGEAGAQCIYTIAGIPPGASGEVLFVVTLDSDLPLTAQTIRLNVSAEGVDQVVYDQQEIVVTPMLQTTRRLFMPYVQR
ncbi:MAG: hypothetical protein DYG89_17040 [Caldilinea sp. CFX5]|nr:hypothetical protein [Caldilinea sp. CFX5]